MRRCRGVPQPNSLHRLNPSTQQRENSLSWEYPGDGWAGIQLEFQNIFEFLNIWERRRGWSRLWGRLGI